MLEFILAPRRKYIRNFSMSGGLQTYFTTLFLLVCFVCFYLPFVSLLFYFTPLWITPDTNRVFFFVWETSNKPCACYFSSCCNKCSAIFTPKHRWYLKAKHRMSSENAGCTQTPLKPKPWKVLCCHHLIQPSIAFAHVSVSRTSGIEIARIFEGIYGWFVTTNVSGSEFQKLNL